MTSTDSIQQNDPWYADGLQFECAQCGNCCTGEPGMVWVSEEEIETLAQLRGLSIEEFSSRYTRLIGERVSLIEKDNNDCIFYSRTKGCLVYEARPIQCRTWPFWNSNLQSEDAWQEMQESCKGAGVGKLYNIEQIEDQAAKMDL